MRFILAVHSLPSIILSSIVVSFFLWLAVFAASSWLAALPANSLRGSVVGKGRVSAERKRVYLCERRGSRSIVQHDVCVRYFVLQEFRSCLGV